MKSGVEVRIDKVAEVLKAAQALAAQRVYAGVPSTKASRNDDEPINNAALMFIHEFGAPEANIPARPVVFPAVKSIQNELIAEQKAGAKAALAGRPQVVPVMLNRMGLMAQNAMRKRITDGPFVPLSPRTISARRSHGRKGTKPLIDKGLLRRALTYVVRNLTGGKFK